MKGRDTDCTFGLRVSKGKYEKQRCGMSFETVEVATERTRKSKMILLKFI